jgi:hypothetical protein|nr:MAG TPA: hypothetical protein [Caudoviricetes sp.]
MNFYVIRFYRQYEDDNVEHNFFAYALTQEEAIKRFCSTTGYAKSVITNIERISQ